MRRAIDIVVATVALAALSPLFLITALAVIIDSPGSAFFRGWRVGKDGRLFRMWKFRSMTKGAEKGAPITGANDARVTGVGRLLRRTKLDELPQFLNVLTGDMTLVGPRPEAPEVVARYTPRQRAVLGVRPGVTGRAQLDAGEEPESIPEGVDPHEYYVERLMEPKLQRDLEYLSVRTPLSDARIVFETATYMLRSLAGK